MVMPTRCPFCGNMIGDYRSPMGCEVCNPPDSIFDESKEIKNLILETAIKTVTRCEVTGNLCGSDTWEINSPCQCKNCKKYIDELNNPPLIIL